MMLNCKYVTKTENYIISKKYFVVKKKKKTSISCYICSIKILQLYNFIHSSRCIHIHQYVVCPVCNVAEMGRQVFIPYSYLPEDIDRQRIVNYVFTRAK